MQLFRFENGSFWREREVTDEVQCKLFSRFPKGEIMLPNVLAGLVSIPAKAEDRFGHGVHDPRGENEPAKLVWWGNFGPFSYTNSTFISCGSVARSEAGSWEFQVKGF